MNKTNAEYWENKGWLEKKHFKNGTYFRFFV